MNTRTFKASDAHRLDDPERLKWLPPDEAIQMLSLEPGMTVADIGAGTGYFSLPFARAVAPEGRVLAVDLQPQMLAILRGKLQSPGMPGNIQLLKGTATQTGIAARRCDLVFLANIWHELDDHAAVLCEMVRILKPGGRIAILDWRHDLASPPGPPADHRVAQHTTTSVLVHAGWHIRHSGAFGQYSYLLVGTRPSVAT
jgi:ubiquinone/menaquinone biosynthesis C-methylase UbiE